MTLLLLRDSGCRRPHADDLEDALLIPRAIVVDLFAVMDDKAAFGNRLHTVRVVLCARIHPPRSLEYRDVTVVRMKVRTAVLVRRPPREHDVEARLRWIASHNSLVRTAGGANPLDVLRKLNGDCLRIEVRGSNGAEPDEKHCDERKANGPPHG